MFGSSTYVAQLLCGNISYATLQRGIHWHWPIAINAVAVFAVSVAVALSIKEPSVGRFFNQRKVQHSLQGLRESPKSSLQVHCIPPCFRYANPHNRVQKMCMLLIDVSSLLCGREWSANQLPKKIGVSAIALIHSKQTSRPNHLNRHQGPATGLPSLPQL